MQNQDERKKIIETLTNWQRTQVERTLAEFGTTWNRLSLETLRQAQQMKKPPKG